MQNKKESKITLLMLVILCTAVDIKRKIVKDTLNKGAAVDSMPRKSVTERCVNRLIQRFLNMSNKKLVMVLSIIAVVCVPLAAAAAQAAPNSEEIKSTTNEGLPTDSERNCLSSTDCQNSQPESNGSYYITVYLKSQLVVVYDDNSNVINAFSCSSGKASTPTRTGDYKIHHKYRWRLMIGNSYTQYASAFSGSYLFHSIPYNKQKASTMSNSAYDKLGSPASAGCIRLCCRDTKWIYDNCPIGTHVQIVDEEAPEGISPLLFPPRIRDSKYSGWDPTDSDDDNPYNKTN